MKTKEKKIKITLKGIIYGSFAFFAILYATLFFKMYFPINKSYAKEVDSKPEQETKISNANEIDIDQIITQNTNNGQTEEITKKEQVLEYLKQYRTNNEVPKGI